MTDRKQGIVADLLGVLLEDSFPPVVGIYEKTHRLEEGTLQYAKDKHLKPFFLGQIGYREFWRNTFREVGIELTNGQIEDINRKVIDGARPYQSLETVKKLRPKYVLGLLTNSPDNWLEAWDKRYGLSKIFDVVISSCQVHMRKPEIGMMELPAIKMNLPAWKIDFHDDKLCNVDAGIKVGMNGNKVTPGINSFLGYERNGR